jgi:hypothetical protein
MRMVQYAYLGGMLRRLKLQALTADSGLDDFRCDFR